MHLDIAILHRGDGCSSEFTASYACWATHRPLSPRTSRTVVAWPLASAVCSSAPTTAPSPIAAPTRLTDPDRTSPAANTPRTLVSIGNGRPDPSFDRPPLKGTS